MQSPGEVIIPEMVPPPPIRKFESGACRDTDEGKLDYEGFLNPLVLERFARYMHKNRKMRDGSLRDSDNWQKGIPIPQYIKSLLRHVIDLWKVHRTGTNTIDIESGDSHVEDTLCAIMFNAQGCLLEILKDQRAEEIQKWIEDALQNGGTRCQPPGPTST